MLAAVGIISQMLRQSCKMFGHGKEPEFSVCERHGNSMSLVSCHILRKKNSIIICLYNFPTVY